MQFINGVKLQKISTQSDSAKTLVDYLANRERFRRFTDIGRLKNLLTVQGETIVDEDYMDAWKKLEAEGCGSIIYGRNGKSDRFEWHYNLKDIGRAAVEGEKIKVTPLTEIPLAPIIKAKNPQVYKTKKRSTKSKKTPPVQKTITNSRVMIPVRENLVLDFVLPDNITRSELNAISHIFTKLAI